MTEVYQLQPTLATLETFSYDDVGNRSSDTDYNDYSYNSNNQLTSYDSVTFNYDKNGNLTKKTENGTNITTYAFDYENKLIRIDYPDETYSAYKYDPLGRRIQKRDRSGNVRRYVYDGYDFIEEYDGSNNLLASYVQGLGFDNPISMYRNSQMYWYHGDALGSIYEMTDEDQTVAKSYDYSAFGKMISETGALDNPFTYTGREFDSESGLYYYRARYYDAGAGRFLSRDWVISFFENGTADILMATAIGLLLESPGTNLYSYSINNPINPTDPFGLKPFEDPRDPDPWSKFCLEIYRLKQENCYLQHCAGNLCGCDTAQYSACMTWAETQYYHCLQRKRKGRQ